MPNHRPSAEEARVQSPSRQLARLHKQGDYRKENRGIHPGEAASHRWRCSRSDSSVQERKVGRRATCRKESDLGDLPNRTSHGSKGHSVGRRGRSGPRNTGHRSTCPLQSKAPSQSSPCHQRPLSAALTWPSRSPGDPAGRTGGGLAASPARAPPSRCVLGSGN